MIWKELKDTLIFLNLKAADNKEVLQIMGDAMIQEGYGEEGFTKAAVWYKLVALKLYRREGFYYEKSITLPVI